MLEEDKSSVRVALRVRPQLAREKIDGCRLCTTVTVGEPQIVLGNDKAFTFDHVFDIETSQELVYEDCASSLIEGCLEGYNATILAYGQTGSGKTHTMGTGFDLSCALHEVGIIPRAVAHLFKGIDSRRHAAAASGCPAPAFHVSAQFLELYNEDIYDLLGAADGSAGGLSRSRDSGFGSKLQQARNNVRIHEDASGGIYATGMTSRSVSSPEETMECLKIGALSRTTASTAMNSQSSRSHAIFTLIVKQTRVFCPSVDNGKMSSDGSPGDENDGFESLSAKFHFVDLAGSERLKRTGATGDRAKEGISINCGLLALGNVISALGDQTKRGSHVPYRDSKLTRLLQDSLGGNSRTVMIACVSPSDRDFMETLNTLKYANRARNIKNKVVVNQDKTSKQLAELRAQVQALQLELIEYKQGKKVVGPDGVETINDMFHENSLLQAESEKMRERVRALQETVDGLTARNSQLLADRALPTADNDSVVDLRAVVEGYIREIEELRGKLMEAEAACSLLRKKTLGRSPAVGTLPSGRLSSSLTTSTTSSSGLFLASQSPVMQSSLCSPGQLIELAKKDIARLKKQFSCPAILSDAESNNNDKGSEVMSGSSGGEDSGERAESQEKSLSSSSSREDSDGLVLPAAAQEVGGAVDLAGVGAEEEEGDDEEEERQQEDLSSDSDSSTTDKELEHMEEDLAALTCDISLKEKLIDELERSRRQLDAIRAQYEEKLAVLHDRIVATERERDDVLRSLGEKKSASEEQVKKVKDDFEKKLNAMQGEVSRLSTARREHTKLLRENAQHDRQLKSLQTELVEMKKAKVRLMMQMRVESEKNRQVELQRTKELAQLRRDQRLKDVQIRTLEQQKKEKDNVLKRKLEEVEQLRRRQRDASGVTSAKSASAERLAKNNSINLTQHSANGGISQSVATTPAVQSAPLANGRGSRAPAPRKVFSPKLAKQRWDKLEHHITSVVARRQTITALETDMDKYIRKREELSKRMDRFTRKLGIALDEQQIELTDDLRDQIETLTSTINFVQGNIEECQNGIMQMEGEAKDESSVLSLLATLSHGEARYLLEHTVNLAVSKGLACSQKEAALREAEERVRRTEADGKLREQLLTSVIRDHVPDLALIEPPWTADEDSSAWTLAHAGDSMPSEELEPISLRAGLAASAVTELQEQHADATALQTRDAEDAVRFSSSSPPPAVSRRDKARRRTQTTADLLFAAPGGSCAAAIAALPWDGAPDTHSSTEEDEEGTRCVFPSGTIGFRSLLTIEDIAPPAPTTLPPIDTIVEEEEEGEEQDAAPGSCTGPRVPVARDVKTLSPSPPDTAFTTSPSPAVQAAVPSGDCCSNGLSSRFAEPPQTVCCQPSCSELPDVYASTSDGEAGSAASPIGGALVNLPRALGESYTVLNSGDGSSDDGVGLPRDASAEFTAVSDDQHGGRCTATDVHTAESMKGSRCDEHADGVAESTASCPRGPSCIGEAAACPAQDKCIVKKLPPRPPAKPSIVRSASIGSMAKWRGSSNSNLDSFTSVDGDSALTSESGERTLHLAATGGRQQQDASTNADIKVLGRRKLSASGLSPTMRRKVAAIPSASAVTNGGSGNSSYVFSSKDKQEMGKEGRPLSLPPSPTASRRSSLPQENVFSRLSVSSKMAADRGAIESVAAASNGDRSRPTARASGLGTLTAARIATGHTSSVLSVCATRQLLFSGSIDRTCKIWDLTIGCEIMSTGGHANSVARVRFSEATNMLFTVSAAFVKVWDIRTAGPKCVKILSSSGLAHDDVPVDLLGSRPQVPASTSASVQQADVLPIFDACLSSDGRMIFTTSGSNVRMWDLRMYGAVGKVTSGHQGHITALALDDASLNPAVLCTGSKDHHVRTFELSVAAASVSSVSALPPPGASSRCISGCTLDPPHYDGVQAVALRGAQLFSGSRDMCIKKYDVIEQVQKQSISSAHKDWVCDLTFLPDVPVLASCCRSGCVRLWDTDACTVIDEVKASDGAVNSMAVGGPADSYLFTASSDGSIGIWTIDYSDLRD